jgi:hypothetical protein
VLDVVLVFFAAVALGFGVLHLLSQMLILLVDKLNYFQNLLGILLVLAYFLHC